MCTEKIARNPSRKRVGEHIQALQSFVAELDTASDVLPVASLCERANEAIDAGNLFRFAAAIVGNVLLKPSHGWEQSRIKSESLALYEGIKAANYGLKLGGDDMTAMSMERACKTVPRPLRVELLQACGHNEHEAERFADVPYTA